MAATFAYPMGWRPRHNPGQEASCRGLFIPILLNGCRKRRRWRRLLARAEFMWIKNKHWLRMFLYFLVDRKAPIFGARDSRRFDLHPVVSGNHARNGMRFLPH